MTASPTTRIRDSDIVSASWTSPEAFAELFDRYSDMLYRYVSRRLGPEISEDLVGETFLVAFARRTHYDLTYTDARPWLFGILTKLLSRHRRTETARYRMLQRHPVEDVLESPADRTAERVTAHASRPVLASTLAVLSPKDRDVLLLVAWSDLSYVEVARALDIPIGTVRSRLNRARRKARAALGDTNPINERE
ncbi:RNA polymerase sigma factor [Streptosporangium subroseum]|uniref:RNA polymerase sigma factor n=1 Tax=Streptosporangium subroseum TaxID=106412 RepID=UPI00342C45DD